MQNRDSKYAAFKLDKGYILMEANDFGWDYTIVEESGLKLEDGYILSGTCPPKKTAETICKPKRLNVIKKEDYDDILKYFISSTNEL